jgi:hypothetical protein
MDMTKGEPKDPGCDLTGEDQRWIRVYIKIIAWLVIDIDEGRDEIDQGVEG